MANFATFFAGEAVQEQEHYRKVLDYLADWNVPEVPKLPAPYPECTDFETVLNHAYKLEADLLTAYSDVRRNVFDADQATFEFLSGYIKIQTDSVIEYNDLLKQWEGSKALGIIWFDRSVK
jgi:ferritin